MTAIPSLERPTLASAVQTNPEEETPRDPTSVSLDSVHLQLIDPIADGSMSLDMIRAAAKRVFMQPDFYHTLPEPIKRHSFVLQNLLTACPERFRDLSSDLQHNSELQKITLVAACFLGNRELCTQLTRNDASLCQLADELEPCVSRHSRAVGLESLWKIYSFAYYSPYSTHPLILQSRLPKEFKRSPLLAQHILQQNGLLLQYFPELSDDVETALVAVKKTPEAIQFVHPSLRMNQLFLQKIFPTKR